LGHSGAHVLEWFMSIYSTLTSFTVIL